MNHDSKPPTGKRPPDLQDLAPHAVIIEGVAHNGRPCRVVDNTGTVDRQRLKELLDELVQQRQFGLQGLSGSGDNAIPIGGPRYSHVQIGNDLYRLLLFPYEARIEKF